MSATSQNLPEQERLRQLFIGAMGAVATGVTVVATGGPGGQFAQTVSAMSSVSADPPLLLVCLNSRSPINAAISANGVLTVNVLGRQHDHVADTFAGRPWPGKEPWDFTCGEWVDAPSGAPWISDAIARFDCTVHDIVRAGSHLVVISRVVDVGSDPGEPLIYSAQTYAKPVPVPPSVFPEYPGSGPIHRTTTKENTK